MIGAGPIGTLAVGGETTSSGGSTLVSQDLVAAYQMSGVVNHDLTSTYGLGGLVGANLVAAYNIGYVVPYVLPYLANTSTLIGTNAAIDVKDAAWTTTQWNAGVFEAYGGGAYNPKYSPVGAYVFCAMGGHGHNQVMDQVLFDFSDATWKRFADSNGAPNNISAGVTDANTTGSPYYELLSVTGSVPRACHTYANMIAIDDGTKGSVMHLLHQASSNGGNGNNSTHALDCDTSTYSRVTNSLSSQNDNSESTAVYDPTTNRYYYVPHDISSYQNLAYLDWATRTWATTVTYAWPSAPGSGNSGKAMIEPTRHFLLLHKTGALQGLDVTSDATIATGWTTLTTSGTVPNATGATWVWHPIEGKFYQKPDAAGNTLNVLTPPVGSLKTGTWAFSTITIGGGGLPTRVRALSHYTGLMYIPYLQRLAWVPDGTQGNVAIIATSDVITQVSKDLTAAYSLLGLVQKDLTAAYGIRAYISSDLVSSYSVAAATTLVHSDLVCTYSILVDAGLVHSDLVAAYAISGRVFADLVCVYSILSETTFVRAPAGGGFSPRQHQEVIRPAAKQDTNR